MSALPNVTLAATQPTLSVGVTSASSVHVSTLPEVTLAGTQPTLAVSIASLPSVAVSSLPNLDVHSLPLVRIDPTYTPVPVNVTEGHLKIDNFEGLLPVY